MTCVPRRNARSSALHKPTIGRPLNSTCPEVGGASIMTACPVVVSPQPDSPTIPSVSPLSKWKETPSTAFYRPTVRDISPFLTGK